MSSESSTPAPPSNESAAPAPAEKQQAPDQMRDLERVVKQADMLKERNLALEQQLETLSKAQNERNQEEKKKAEALAEEERNELELHRKREQERMKKYAEENTPKAEEYIKFREQRDGEPLVDEDVQAIMRTFTVPTERLVRVKGGLESEMNAFRQQEAAITASKEALKKREQEIEEERKRFQEKEKKIEELIKSGNANMRAQYQMQMLQEPEKVEQHETAVRKTVEINAARRTAGEIAMRQPNEYEKGFLAGYNWSDSVDVNASSMDDPYAPVQQLYPTSMPPIRQHHQLLNEQGEFNFPYSQRYTDPAIFSYYTNYCDFAADENLSQYVRPVSQKTFLDASKSVDERPGITRGIH
jgi:hypothetical protein